MPLVMNITKTTLGGLPYYTLSVSRGPQTWVIPFEGDDDPTRMAELLLDAVEHKMGNARTYKIAELD